MRLRRNPPLGFVEARANQDATELIEQERIARSYWEMAVEFVQDNYPFGTDLPGTPPSDFRLQDEGYSSARILYWDKLRELWKQPETWGTSYEWNTEWVNQAINSLLRVAENYLHL